MITLKKQHFQKRMELFVMQIAAILVFIDIFVLLYTLQSILSLSAPAAVWTCSSFEYSRTAMHMGAFFWGLGTG
ncbi:hypothetical protein Peur_046032 [Populus x canadensis]